MTDSQNETDTSRKNSIAWSIAAIVVALGAAVIALVRAPLLIVIGAIGLSVVCIIFAFFRDKRILLLGVAGSVVVAAIVIAIFSPRGSSSGGQASRLSTVTPTSTSTPLPSSQATEPPGPDASGELPRIGEESSTTAGVSLTVNALTCGLDSAGEGTPPPTGDFCSVQFTVTNEADGAIDIFATDLQGHTGDTTFLSVPGIGRLGDDMSTATVLPGAAIDGVLFFDVPTSTSLDRLSISGQWFNGAVDVSAPTDSK